MNHRALMLILALGLLFAGACGGDDDEPAGDATAGKASGSITVWAPGVEGEKLPGLARDFEKANPGVKVKVTPIAIDQAHDKILTSIAGNQAPDVSWVGSTWMGEFAKTGALDEAPSSIDQEQFFQGARDAVNVEDKVYGVPWHVETRVLFYRTDIAKKAGITKPPETWDELKETARAMKEKGGAKYGINLSTNNWQEYLPFIWQNGGEVAEGDQYTLDSPEVVEATEFYQSFFEEGLAPPQTPQGFDVTPAFVRGTHPMFFSGPWHMGLVDEAGGKGFDKKWDIAKMPAKETGTSWVGGGELVVFKQSKNRETAWKFVEYLTQPEVQAKFYELSADLPANQQAWELPQLSEDPKVQVFGEQLEDAKTAPPFPKWEQFATELNAKLDQAFTSGQAPAEAVKGFQAAAEETGTQ
jgi:multiple sugar transport system substrate-binding protein